LGFLHSLVATTSLRKTAKGNHVTDCKCGGKKAMKSIRIIVGVSVFCLLFSLPAWGKQPLQALKEP
jgi:hypothetical protein